MEISLLITTYERGHLLRQSLERLGNYLTLPAELIVVDDGGSDDTEEVVKEFAFDFQSVECRYVYTHNPGQTICSHARNVGLRLAKHDWLVTSEPELIFRTDALEQFSRLESEHPGKVISTGLVWFAPQEWRPGSDYEPPHGSQQAVHWVAPHAAFWHRDWLMEVGGWDEGFPGPWGWDDTDLLTRLQFSGHPQFIADEVEAIHLWHGIGGDESQQNEQYFRAKPFVGSETYSPDDLIANKGEAWGTPKPR